MVAIHHLMETLFIFVYVVQLANLDVYTAYSIVTK